MYTEGQVWDNSGSTRSEGYIKVQFANQITNPAGKKSVPHFTRSVIGRPGLGPFASSRRSLHGQHFKTLQQAFKS